MTTSMVAAMIISDMIIEKDNDGKVYTVSTKCAHLGCELHWNADELTWDCPCHGSRFDYKGNWIESLTNKSLDEI